MNTNDFFQYRDFADFCAKNNCTPEEGLSILKEALRKLGERKHESKPEGRNQ